MIEELQAEIAKWRRAYANLGKKLGQIINEQQDTILALRSENKRLKRENWNFRKTKGRRK
nr:MAG TPA: Protein HEXIM1 T-binding domain (TBD), Cyclin.1A [Caudoviricetes sp.]